MSDFEFRIWVLLQYISHFVVTWDPSDNVQWFGLMVLVVSISSRPVTNVFDFKEISECIDGQGKQIILDELQNKLC